MQVSRSVVAVVLTAFVLFVGLTVYQAHVIAIQRQLIVELYKDGLLLGRALLNCMVGK